MSEYVLSVTATIEANTLDGAIDTLMEWLSDRLNVACGLTIESVNGTTADDDAEDQPYHFMPWVKPVQVVIPTENR